MRILCVGTNHRRAALGLREKLAFGPDRRQAALDDLRRRWPQAEFAILSTCNRTEVYAARAVHAPPREEELRAWLGEFQGLSGEQFADCLYAVTDEQAAEHLFAVAAGLDSLIFGEDQIVGQVKDAYGEAVRAGAARAVLNELFQGALHVAKHIRSETDIVLGKVSVASVAVDFVRQVFETLAGRCVLNVGAGKMNELMLRHLRRLAPGRIVIVNRTPRRAEELAAAWGPAEVGDFERLGQHLAEADIVLTSTGSDRPIISAGMVQTAQAARRFRPLLIVDIAVPRDVEPAAGQVENVFLYNVDDLEGIVRGSLALRQDQRAAAEEIISDHVEELTASLHVRRVAPAIEALYRRMEAIAAEELADARNRLARHDDAQSDEEILRRALHRTVRRILHPAVERLRRSAGTDEARRHLEALRDLFGLDEP